MGLVKTRRLTSDDAEAVARTPKGQTLLIQFIDTVAREVMSWDL